MSSTWYQYSETFLGMSNLLCKCIYTQPGPLATEEILHCKLKPDVNTSLQPLMYTEQEISLQFLISPFLHSGKL